MTGSVGPMKAKEELAEASFLREIQFRWADAGGQERGGTTPGHGFPRRMKSSRHSLMAPAERVSRHRLCLRRHDPYQAPCVAA